jgi:hypothetical protein
MNDADRARLGTVDERRPGGRSASRPRARPRAVPLDSALGGPEFTSEMLGSAIPPQPHRERSRAGLADKCEGPSGCGLDWRLGHQDSATRCAT